MFNLDFNDFDTPIKSFVDDRVSFYLLSGIAKLVKIYAKLNKAELNDDYMKLNPTVNKEFFSVDRIQSDIGTLNNDIICQTIILLDPNADTYQRTVFSILDLFGTVGGIFGLLQFQNISFYI